MVCTNSEDFYNYLQNKGVHCIMYSRPVEGLLNIFFPETHNITVCGNRYNEQRIKSGEMKKEFEEIKKLLETPDTIVITPITMYGGKVHKKYYPESVLNVPRQRIHTSKLGELVYPHWVHIYGAELKPTTDIEPKRDYVNYYPHKRQDTLYYNAFYVNASKEERRKKRHIPEYALYSALYNQVIKEVDDENRGLSSNEK